jgi:hypothetical protein
VAWEMLTPEEADALGIPRRTLHLNGFAYHYYADGRCEVVESSTVDPDPAPIVYTHPDGGMIFRQWPWPPKS